MEIPKSGQLLIAEPFLKDSSFQRAVVLLCDHNKEGSFGLLLNKPLKLTMKDVLMQLYNCTIPIYYGGPVQTDTLHILHQLPSLIPGAQKIAENIYWGGDINVVISLLETRAIDESKIRFYLGYSGWGQGQLLNEMYEEKSWITVSATSNFIFHNNINQLWADAVSYKGGTYNQWKNYPIDPQLN
jgi:putative transcriptional regulator